MQTSASRSDYPSSPGIFNLTTNTEAGEQVQYTLRIPDTYDGQTALPVILCLHFGGQASDFYGRIFLELIPGPGFEDVPAFLVAPTTFTRDWTTPAGEAVVWAALDEVERSLPVETDKRVVMGYSMGASERGTWRRRFATALWRPFPLQVHRAKPTCRHYTIYRSMSSTVSTTAWCRLRPMPLPCNSFATWERP